MNGDSSVSVDEVLSAIRSVEVFSLFFPLVRRSLLVDLRSDAENPPFVKLVLMANSAEERLGYLHRIRPGLPRLEGITLIPWNRYVGSLVQSGIFDALLKRIAGAGDPYAIRACHEALKELERQEQHELIAAIRGENYHTLWTRRK